jgi:hypothetical protein
VADLPEPFDGKLADIVDEVSDGATIPEIAERRGVAEIDLLEFLANALSFLTIETPGMTRFEYWRLVLIEWWDETRLSNWLYLRRIERRCREYEREGRRIVTWHGMRRIETWRITDYRTDELLMEGAGGVAFDEAMLEHSEWITEDQVTRDVSLWP